MRSNQRIVSYIMGFILCFGAVVGLAYLLGQNLFGSEQVMPIATTLGVGGIVFATVALMALFFLKKLTKLSRQVEHDDSKFEASRIPEHGGRSNIQYY